MNRLLLPVGVLCFSFVRVAHTRGRACRTPSVWRGDRGPRGSPWGPRTRAPSEAASGTQIGPTAVERKTQGYPARRRRVKTGPYQRLSVQAGCPKTSSDRKRARPLTARVAPFVVRSVTAPAPLARSDDAMSHRGAV